MQQRLPRPHVVSVTSRHITHGHQRQEHRIKMPNTSGALQQGIQQVVPSSNELTVPGPGKASDILKHLLPSASQAAPPSSQVAAEAQGVSGGNDGPQ